jgi:hypothetical protein
MARARLISTESSIDPELNSISPYAMLLYLLTIPHLDRDGLIDAHPLRLTAIAAPLRLELRDGAQGLIDEWVATGLVVRYQVDQQRGVLFFKGFRKHQSGLEYGREPASRFPPPPGWTRTRDGLVPDSSELCARLAEGLHGKSQYRAALLKRAGLDAPEPEPAAAPEPELEPVTADIADGSRTVREECGTVREQFAMKINQRSRDHDLIGDDGDHHTTHPIQAEGGVLGGGRTDLAMTFSEADLRVAAYQLGSLLGLVSEWSNFEGYIGQRSMPTLVMLTEWIWWYLGLGDAALERINSVTGVIRNHMNQGAKPPLTTHQRRALVAKIDTVLTIAQAEAA